MFAPLCLSFLAFGLFRCLSPFFVLRICFPRDPSCLSDSSQWGLKARPFLLVQMNSQEIMALPLKMSDFCWLGSYRCFRYDEIVMQGLVTWLLWQDCHAGGFTWLLVWSHLRYCSSECFWYKYPNVHYINISAIKIDSSKGMAIAISTNVELIPREPSQFLLRLTVWEYPPHPRCTPADFLTPTHKHSGQISNPSCKASLCVKCHSKFQLAHVALSLPTLSAKVNKQQTLVTELFFSASHKSLPGRT